MAECEGAGEGREGGRGRQRKINRRRRRHGWFDERSTPSFPDLSTFPPSLFRHDSHRPQVQYPTTSLLDQRQRVTSDGSRWNSQFIRKCCWNPFDDSRGFKGSHAVRTIINLILLSLLTLRLCRMITLLVTSASPSLSLLTVSAPSTAHTIVETSTFRTIFITIPSALSLDFASAFGQALLFLFLLTFFAFLGLYEFYRFTGGWQGPKGVVRRGETDLGEGYDREDLHVRKKRFRDRKGWRIAVTFFLTSIYLPLSKLSLSALFWERGYWPSELLGTDPLDDRCFTTIPRGGGKGFNSAIAIFPVALCVLGLLSCWFPIRMYGIVQSSRPSVDRFTELGEVRRDRKGECESLAFDIAVLADGSCR